MNDFEEMDTIIKNMRRAGWSMTITANKGKRDYTASFSKLVQTSRPGGPKRSEIIGGEDDGLTMPEAVKKAADNALAYEVEKTKPARKS